MELESNKQSDFSLFGTDMFGDKVKQIKKAVLAKKYEVPPFTILNARDGLWQARKRAWISCGIKSEVGRDAVTFQIGDKATWDNQVKARKLLSPGGGGGPNSCWIENATDKDKSGTSIFDPTLCELMYRWFCPEGGQIVDPFAGGSVRGIVAGLMGYKYHGIDLRQEQQVTANEEQRREIALDCKITYVCGDSITELDNAPPADFIFSCPPYGDLERYSDDPADLSTMEYHTFLAAYKRIILRCAKILKPGAMACFVVGDFRDKKTGYYRGFVADTIKAFQEVGLEFYNDAILITSVGSLPIRVGKQFESGRKLGKTHQNVLIFQKPMKTITR